MRKWLGNQLIALGYWLRDGAAERRLEWVKIKVGMDNKTRLGPDWKKWPVEAQMALLNYLREIEAK